MRELLPTIAAAVTPLILLAILLVGPTLGLVEWQPSILWKTEFGNRGYNTQNEVTAVSGDKTGLYAAGDLRTYSNVTGPSSYRVLNRYDFNGGQVWSRDLGSVLIMGISAGVDGVYVAGRNFNGSDYFIQKYDLSGKAIWTSQFNGLSGYSSVSVGSDGVYMAGLGPLNPNQTYPIMVRGYDFNGNAIWTKAVANGNGGGVSTVYARSTGVYVIGSDRLDRLDRLDTHAFVSKYDSNGDLQWKRQFDQVGFTCWCAPTSISGDSSGIYVLGDTENAFPGQSYGGLSDTFVRKYDSNGSVLWTIQFNAPSSLNTNGVEISADPSGVYLLVNGDHQVFALKYDGNGNRVWSLPIVASAISVGENSLYVGGSGDYYAFVAGVSQSSSLILFGVNPPFSFVIAALLVSAVLSSVLWLGNGWRKRPRPLQRIPPPATIPRKGLET